jgi:hypothetical protein
VAEALLTGRQTNGSRQRFRKTPANCPVNKAPSRKSDCLVESAAQRRGANDEAPWSVPKRTGLEVSDGAEAATIAIRQGLVSMTY